MAKKQILSLVGLVLLFFVVGIYFYPQMPDRMASHWDINGQVNGYMPKFWGLFLMPILSAVLLLFFILIPKLDPLKANIEEFKNYFFKFVFIIFLFLLYIHLLTIFWSLGERFNMVVFMSPALGIIFYYAGVLVGKAKRNWFIGIRTPWTMSNDIVWDKTHKLGGKLFKLSGIISLLGAIFPAYAFWLIFVPVISTAVYTIIYSYFEYKKLTVIK